jgi:anaerobic magnesium-protoporphyrin IX monomethyl ester cyclase
MRVLFYYRGSEQLGVEALAAILMREGHEVGLIYDPGADNVFFFELPIFKRLRVEDRLVKQAIEFQPDLIAFSCITNLYPYEKSISKRLKQDLNVPFVIGGVHPSTVPDKVIEDGLFDYLCTGEGDYALLDLVTALETGGDTTSIQNITAIINDKVYKNDTRPLIQDLDELPFPDKSLFYDRGAFYRSLLIMTSRGCPFKCSFCVNNFYHEIKKPHEKPVRQKTVPYSIREIQKAMNYGKPQSISFLDDIFGIHHGWLDEFASIYPKKVGLPFLCNTYPSMVTKKHVALLKKSGCATALMGIQSGSPEVRSRMLRKETNEQIEQAVQYLSEGGIKVQAEFIFGYPEETDKQMWESVELSQRIKSKGAVNGTFVFYPFPETQAQRDADAASLIDESQWRKITEGEGSYHTTLMMDQPFRNEALNLASLVPFFNYLPAWFTRKVLHKVYKYKNGLHFKIIGIMSIVIMGNPWFLRERILNLSYMLLRIFKKPKFLEKYPQREVILRKRHDEVSFSTHH